ncbi:MAG: hypothetical protein HN757_09275, partial [Calditrichaeota bacterium]|nr:hypothetical protein [Calditrichota bacterium]
MGKSGDAADQNVLGTTGNSIRGTVVSVPEPAEQLTSGLAENGNGNFHPDGSRIIFQSNRDGKWQIYELNLTDMSELRLHESDFIEENPVWTSKGSNYNSKPSDKSQFIKIPLRQETTANRT